VTEQQPVVSPQYTTPTVLVGTSPNNVILRNCRNGAGSFNIFATTTNTD